MSAKITREVLEAYLHCKTKAHLKLAGQQGNVSDYEALLLARRQEVRQQAIGKILSTHPESEVARDIPLTAAALHAGPPIVLHATLEDDLLSLRFDGLKRVDGPSRLGDFHYVPMLFHEGRKIGKEQRLLMELLGLVLSQVQGRLPAIGVVWHGPECRAAKVRLNQDVRKTERLLQEVKGTVSAGSPPKLMLNDHCRVCEFRRSCQAIAIEKDDLSLLRGLSPNDIGGLNRRGIFTVTQYSHTFRPRKARKAQPTSGSRKHHHSLQALAIRDGTIYVAEKPVLPSTTVRIYLDVEGQPDTDLYYLIGLVISQGEAKQEYNLWAEGREDEGRIWQEFLRIVNLFGEFTIFHYGSYESKFLRKMIQRHGGDPHLLKKVEESLVNVLSLIYSRVYFPVYANDLKCVASYLGFRWTVDGASGLQAVVWRQEWETKADERARGALIAYNREDCLALERVVTSLLVIAGDDWDEGGTPQRIAAAEDIKQGSCRNYGKGKYYFPELARITKCSYFEYQRKRILFRTSPLLKRFIRPKGDRRRKGYRANTVVPCRAPEECLRCGNSDGLRVATRYNKTVLDLKLSPGGVKRWVTKYIRHVYKCKKCNASFLPDDGLAVPGKKYGHKLCAWAVYTTVALRQTNENVVESLADLFGYQISPGMVSLFRKRAAQYYRSIYEALLQELKSGAVVHVDETKVSVRRRSTNGYVWAFANPETVYYVYAATRGGKIVGETLDGFHGVLVSDFYAAYDSLPCPQQKCLIHLVRDFNDDLFKNPFDEELKQLGRDFTLLLQTIVQTIDKYGLKRLHLAKHRTDVNRFYTRLVIAEYRSEVAEYYRKRLTKNKDKLFTFLEYDGVPWNNNNGENAIKRFVALGKILGTAFSEDGIKDYLVLLSISQTLRYRNQSFWKFLISGETDIARFITKNR
jgi:predicted RecB family nuclease